MKRIALLGLAAALWFTGARGAEPEYPHGNFFGECATCHTPDRWVPAKVGADFRHPGDFPLRGAHKTAPCRSCHLALDFASTPTACADCHSDVHLAELGTDCSKCHTPVNFLDRNQQLRDHRTTRFPLQGAHVTQDCQACHTPQPQGSLTWVGLPVECEACHLPLYQATTDPNHVSAGFPTSCALCHVPTVWSRARFDHANTSFPLTGAHTTVPCIGCHAAGYAGTPTACVACHQSDFNGTTDPNHVTAEFPTNCTLCHTTTTWTGASFTQHDSQRFPIYSGTHRNRWDRCTDCHTQPANFASFSCFLCHAQAETNSHHTDVSRYAYDSDRCYECHPQGRH